MDLTERQQRLLAIVKENQPISADDIAHHLGLSKSTLRPDLSFLSHMGLLEAKQKIGYVMGSIATGSPVLSFKDMLVKEVMAVPEVIDIQMPVYEAIATIFLANVGSVYVIKDRFLAGVVSSEDLIKTLIGGSDVRNMPVGIVMTRMPNVVWVTPETSVLDAARLIVSHQIDSMPVVTSQLIQGKLHYTVVGRFSKTVVSRLFVDAFDVGHARLYNGSKNGLGSKTDF